MNGLVLEIWCFKILFTVVRAITIMIIIIWVNFLPLVVIDFN